MVASPYFIPNVVAGPPDGYELFVQIPLARITPLLSNTPADFTVAFRVFGDGRLVHEELRNYRHNGESWVGDDPEFRYAPDKPGRYLDDGSLSYVETHFSVREPVTLSSRFCPVAYNVYAGPGRKTYFSDGGQKYGNPVVNDQVRAYGKWIEGYPLCIIDPKRDVTESVILINAFRKPAVAYIKLSGVNKPLKVYIRPEEAKRIDLRKALGEDDRAWSGQVFVSGKSRAITYFLRHRISDPNQITTIEHTEPFRGETCHIPASQYLRRFIGEQILGMERS